MSLKKQIELAQPLVNERAKQLAVRLDVPTDAFEVVLAPRLHGNAEMILLNGPTVKITLKWPDVLPELTTFLKRALSAIRTRHMYTPLELGTRAYVYKQKDEKNRTRRWVSKKLEKGAQTSVIDLVSHHRIKVSQRLTITYRDGVTGEEISESSEMTFPLSGILIDQKWILLSQIIFEKYPEEMLDDESDTDADTGASEQLDARARGVALVLFRGEVVDSFTRFERSGAVDQISAANGGG